MRATLCLAIATPSNAMPSLSCAMLCPCYALLRLALPSLSGEVLCLAPAVLLNAMLCRCCALRCAMPLLCYALHCRCRAVKCFALPRIALAQLISFWQYADFRSALARLPADLFRVKRLADRAFLHLADYVPPFYSVGHCVSPLSAPSDGVCRVFAPLGM